MKTVKVYRCWGAVNNRWISRSNDAVMKTVKVYRCWGAVNKDAAADLMMQ